MKIDKNRRFQFRKDRVRKTILGSTERPRLCVFRSLKHITAQLIDDTAGRTLFYVSSDSPDLRKELKTGGNVAAAARVGETLAQLAQAGGIKKVVFDRSGWLYHGRVKALADAARKGGLEF
ncbi:MAG: 50S ribosomal protein L18 [Elusimicrobiota bacterium]